MLKSLFDSRHERLLKAISANDVDKLAGLLSKVDAEHLAMPGRDGRHPLEQALSSDEPRILELLLQKAQRPLPTAHCGTPLICLALQHVDSLSKLTLLLQAGEDANRAHQGRQLLHLCIEHCDRPRLMLHLSRLLQHGADINALDANGCTPVQRLLPTGDQALLQFLLQSGAECREEWLADVDNPELVTQLKRVLDDLKIRKIMMGGN
jgi:ankyrin repeat protein